MSLETLLEAAEFLESRSQVGDADGVHRIPRMSPKATDTDGLRKDIRTKNGSGTREVHNKLEKNRRAHLKECFDFLKKNIPSLEEKRTSNLGILRSSLRYIQNLKRKEREFEIEMHRFVHQKIMLQEKIGTLKAELNKMNIDVDINALVQSQEHDNETNSTSTATERGTPPPSDFDELDDDEEEAETLALETNSPTPVHSNNPLKQAHATASPRKSISLSSQAPPKVTDPMAHVNKLTTDTKNGFANPPLPYNKAALMQQSVLRNLFSEMQAKKPVPIIPVAVTLAGHDPSQGITVLRPVSNSALSFGIGVGSQKPVDTGKPRTPVTQLLHQTLTQRQAKQQLTTMLAAPALATAASQVRAPLTVAQLKSPPLSQISQRVSMATNASISSLAVKDENVSVAKSSNIPNIVPQHRLSTAVAPVSTLGASPYYFGSIQKFAHPVLVTSLMAPATGLSKTREGPLVYEPMKVSTNVSANNIPAVVTLKNETQILNQPVINLQTNNAPSTGLSSALSRVSMAVPSVKPGIAVASTAMTGASSTPVPVRHLLAPGMLPSQFAWPFLTIPGSQVIATASGVSSSPVVAGKSTVTTTTTVSTQSSQAASIPVVTVTSVGTLAAAMMTPMTVMSPGIQMTPTALTQAQLNSVIAAPLLKHLQLPLGLQTSLLPTGQVIGQQVKPMVVVSIPNVAPTTSLTNVTTLASST